MLTKTKFYILTFATILFIYACEEDGITVSSSPEVDLVTEVSGLPGQVITFSGLLSDPAGVSTVRLTYEPWFLDKTIEVDPGITQFELGYNFLIPADVALGSEHVVEIVASNPGENTMSGQIRVFIEGDNTVPTLNITGPNDGATFIVGPGPEFTLAFEAADDQGIATVEVVGFGINDFIEVNDVSYSYSKDVDFALSGQFAAQITITDQEGNVTSISRTVNIEESLRFNGMWLADVSSDAELTSDLFGVPMLIEGATDPALEGVQFQAEYYSKTANQEIRFIPQRSSFAPFAFGAGEEPGELALGTDASVPPIVLPEAGYYRIVINFTSFTYSVESFDPADPAFDFISLIGTGVLVNGQNTCESNADGSQLCYNFGSGKPLDQDANNPYLYKAEIDLFDFDPNGEGNNGFILNSNFEGWSPFWRFDVGDQVGLFPEATVPNGGGNFIFGPEAYGAYNFEFDTYLNRVRMTPR